MLYMKNDILKQSIFSFLFLLGSLFVSAQVDSLATLRETRIKEICKDFDTIPVITYNGTEISLEEYLGMPSYRIGTITKYGPPFSERLYGEKGKHGVLCLYMQRNFEVSYDFTPTDDKSFIPTYFYVSEIPAMFPGGDDSLRVFLDRNTIVPKDFYDVEIEGFVEVLCYINEKGSVVKYEIENIRIVKPENVAIFYQAQDGIGNVLFTTPYKKRIQQMKEIAEDVVKTLPLFKPAISFLHPVKYVKPIYVTFSFHQTETVEKRK